MSICPAPATVSHREKPPAAVIRSWMAWAWPHGTRASASPCRKSAGHWICPAMSASSSHGSPSATCTIATRMNLDLGPQAQPCCVRELSHHASAILYGIDLGLPTFANLRPRRASREYASPGRPDFYSIEMLSSSASSSYSTVTSNMRCEGLYSVSSPSCTNLVPSTPSRSLETWTVATRPFASA